MSEQSKVITVGDNFADIHKTADQLADLHSTADAADVETDDMPKTTVPKETFWTLANLRVSLITAVIAAGVSVSAAWTSNLLTQQALAARVDKIETVTIERAKMRDDQIKTINDKLDLTVTREVLKLQLDPIVKEQNEQRAILEQIRIAVVRPSPY